MMIAPVPVVSPQPAPRGHGLATREALSGRPTQRGRIGACLGPMSLSFPVEQPAFKDLRTAAPRMTDAPAPAIDAPACRPPAVPRTTDCSALLQQALMARIVGRDESALGDLYRLCAAKVFSTAVRIVAQHAQAEEVVIDTFWQVWREAPRYDAGRGLVISWIVTIARNRAIDSLRRHSVHGRREVFTEDSLHEALASEEPSTAEAAGSRQRDCQLRALMRRLEPVQRQMLSLSFFQGLSHQQIADHSGLPIGTVKSHLRRTLLQLREDCLALGLAL